MKQENASIEQAIGGKSLPPKLSPSASLALRQSAAKDCFLEPPRGIGRRTFQDLKAGLQAVGGTWSGYLQAFVFPEFAADAAGRLLAAQSVVKKGGV